MSPALSTPTARRRGVVPTLAGLARNRRADRRYARALEAHGIADIRAGGSRRSARRLESGRRGSDYSRAARFSAWAAIAGHILAATLWMLSPSSGSR